MKDNTNGSEIPTLLQTLIQLLEAHRAAFKQARPYWRGVGLVCAELFNFGRHTIAQALLSLGETEGIGVDGIGCLAGSDLTRNNSTASS